VCASNYLFYGCCGIRQLFIVYKKKGVKNRLNIHATKMWNSDKNTVSQKIVHWFKNLFGNVDKLFQQVLKKLRKCLFQIFARQAV
jgi:hypothetical protein